MYDEGSISWIQAHEKVDEFAIKFDMDELVDVSLHKSSWDVNDCHIAFF